MIKSINLIVHLPATEEAREILRRRMAELHADAVIGQLKARNCPTPQKFLLLDQLMEETRRINAKPPP